ncbi:MAG: putative dithiol-disulfide oxidoreductase (DUF899 family) [Patiriisocius sp.]|jgi:predicted dithiol-disulfide oxidoreductase (DUF899 family)
MTNKSVTYEERLIARDALSFKEKVLMRQMDEVTAERQALPRARVEKTYSFVSESDDIYLTYSCFNRGVEPMNGSFAYYDLLPKGRQWKGKAFPIGPCD